jgi:hypothetical protein
MDRSPSLQDRCSTDCSSEYMVVNCVGDILDMDNSKEKSACRCSDDLESN